MKITVNFKKSTLWGTLKLYRPTNRKLYNLFEIFYLKEKIFKLF